MFDDDKSVLAFFDHAKERFAQFPDAAKPVAAQVFGKFPSQKRRDVEDSGKVFPVLDRHPEGKHCPAEPPLRKGTVAVRLFGRALDKDGKPVADTVRQEHYVEDRFNIAIQTQEKLADVLAGAEGGRAQLPVEFARQFVTHAYLGVLDVQPLDNPGRHKGELKKCDFWAERVENAEGAAQWRIVGESDVFIDKMANAGPGDMHEVKLTWHGFIEMDRSRMTRLLLFASGTEKLKFGSARGNDANEVASLPGGHLIDMACEVRYGILGEPAAPNKVATETPTTPASAAPPLGVPDEAPTERVQSIQRKVQRIHRGVRQWQEQGKDPAPVGGLMQEFEPLMRKQKLREAEAVLDRALSQLEETSEGKPKPSPADTPKASPSASR